MAGEVSTRAPQCTASRLAPLLIVTGMAFEAAIAMGTARQRAGASCQFEVLHGLRGPALAAALAERLGSPVSGVLSFGVAGGLTDAAPPGTVFVPDRVIDVSGHASRTLTTDPDWTGSLRRALPSVQRAAVAGSDKTVATVADKMGLHRCSGAGAVDMESHLAGAAAAAACVPFAVCRVVVDSAACEVPAAALAAMGPQGGIDIGGLLATLVARPGDVVALVRLARDAGTARRALRAVRQRLGDGFGLAFQDE